MPPIWLLADTHHGCQNGNAMDAALDSIAREPGPVVIAGDLTADGRPGEFTQATEMLRSLRALGCTLAITPGNHDRKRQGWFDRWRALQAIAREQDGVVAATTSNLIVRHGQDIFVCLRSVHNDGYRIRGYQLEWANDALRGTTAGCRVHLVTHVSLWSHPRHGPMSRRNRLEQTLLLPFGFTSVLHGHVHHLIWNPAERLPHSGAPIVHIGIPTLSGRSGGPSRAFLRWAPGSVPETLTSG